MRKIIHIFLSLVIVYASATSAYANTSIGGWTALDTITAGATNTINAAKGAGASAVRSAVTVAPSVAKVGKNLLKGGGQAAIAYAVVELIGEGIDWVLDPANNAVKYKNPAYGGAGTVPTQGTGYTIQRTAGNGTAPAGVYYKDFATACARDIASAGIPDRSFHSISGNDCWATKGDGRTWWGTLVQKGNVPIQPSKDVPEYKSIPIDSVAAQVIGNAEAGHAPSQEAVKATALEGFAAGEHDAALNSAAVPDTGVENPPDTTDPENPPAPTDPAVPFDPAGIISAINALKALLAGILSSITGLSDIFNSDPPPEKTQSETDVPVELPPEVKDASEFDIDYISFSSQCPSLPSFSVGIGGASSEITFDMTPLCDLAVAIRPAIIAISYFIGLGVIASAIRET